MVASRRASLLRDLPKRSGEMFATSAYNQSLINLSDTNALNLRKWISLPCLNQDSVHVDDLADNFVVCSVTEVKEMSNYVWKKQLVSDRVNTDELLRIVSTEEGVFVTGVALVRSGGMLISTEGDFTWIRLATPVKKKSIRRRLKALFRCCLGTSG